MSADPKRGVTQLVAFGSGLLFAFGLALGGMTLPSKVVGFFDYFGAFDPSLAFVMAGAILVYLPVYRVIRSQPRPFVARRFALPTKTDVDARLVVGAVVFGAGWGLGGFCPGPAITSVGAGGTEALVTVAGMGLGMGAFHVFERRHQRRPGARG